MGVRLPVEYQEVEYLEKATTDYPDTNFTCYIDTGITPASDVVAYGAFKRTAVGFDLYFGAQSGTGTLSRWFINNGRGSPNEYHFCYWYNDTYNDDTRNSLTPWYLLSLSNNGGSSTDLFNGNTQSVAFSATRFPNVPIYLFARNTNGSPTQFSNRLLCKYFVIEKSGEKVRDFVPCYRKADNKPGMYDLVSQTFFVNQGNTEFLVGPDVIDSISPWLVARRRMLMQQEPELYPVGTDIVTEYIGRTGNKGNFNANYVITASGVYTTGNGAASPIYMPVNPKYRYQKNKDRA